MKINSLWPEDAIWRRRSRVNTGSGNGLLPDGTKPLPEPMLTNHQWGLVVFTWEQFHSKSSRDISLIWVWRLLISDYSYISQGSLGTKQNGWHDTDNIFCCIFLKENVCMLTEISLHFVSMGSIVNKSALVQIMAWHLTDDKPLSKPMLTMMYRWSLVKVWIPCSITVWTTNQRKHEIDHWNWSL